MMDKAQLLALADRVEALTGPDRGVDAAIHELRCDGFDMMPDASAELREQIEAQHPGFWEECGGFVAVNVPAYTTSIDAAMTLVPEGMIARQYTAGRLVPHMWEVSRGPDNGGWIGNSDYSSACALTAASLRAMVGGDDGEV